MEKKERKEYCQACNTFVEYSVKTVRQTIEVKDETLDVEIYECYCSKCGEKIFVYEYERLNDNIVYDAYKKRVGLLASSEIKEIRRKRGLTQVELARFLSIGDKDITRYESGAIQNRSIDKMLRLVDDDACYEEMVRVFRGGSNSIWVDLKNVKWDIKKIIICEGLSNEGFWNPYKGIIKRFNKSEEEVVKDYGRKRTEEVPLA